jgi:glutamate-ammonia-ligase adenylyltransferase
MARRLMLGIADHSPFLFDLALRDPDRLAGFLSRDPELSFVTLLDEALTTLSTAPDEAAAMAPLRQMKSGAALLLALADIGEVWPVDRITRCLTEIADAAVSSATSVLLREALRAGRLTHLDPANPGAGSGLIVLAMGKMGAHELNYSSDIDLIVFYDKSGVSFGPGVEPASFYVRLTRALARMLQDRTEDGYVFRVDLRLRPDPASTQAAISIEAALHYYESVGQNWERAAMIKARPCAGDIFAGERFLRELRPFVWRRYLDYAAIADVHQMKRQIHAYRGHDEIAVAGHDVKLGRGGIREIEFFVQTQQLIAGGRHMQLRGRSTLAMLDELVAGGWVDAPDRDRLREAYLYLRRVEHRVQMIADEQTHELPSDPDELERFARFSGFEDAAAFAADLTKRLTIVQAAYAGLFEDAPTLSAYRGAMRFAPDRDDRETLDTLSKLGFRHVLEASALVRDWHGKPCRALRSETARAHLFDIVPLLIEELARGDDPDAALLAFDRFLADLPHGLHLLATLRHSRDLVALLAQILGTAPRLAEIVGRRPQVMDGLLDPAFFARLPDDEQLRRVLTQALDQSGNVEDFLDFTRRFGQEQRFLIGARILSGTVSAAQAGDAFSRLADTIIRTMVQATEVAFCDRHGRVAGQETAVVAMGKLGGRELTAGSDLDLVLLYDFDAEHPESDGQRKLYGSQYFARFTQRLLSALTVQTNAGLLYDVDLRLRPSGRSGPVATSLESFRAYQSEEAWTWEHMALTRARLVSGSPSFVARADSVIHEVLCRPRDPQILAGDVREMRRAIAEEKGEDDGWNLKYARGGLVDLEFIAQYLQLRHAHAVPDILDTNTFRVFDKAQRHGLIEVEDGEALRSACRLNHNLTQILRLCLDGAFDPKTSRPGLRALLARASGLPDFSALDADLADRQARVRAIFDRLVT